VHKLLRTGGVLIDGIAARAESRVGAGAVITLCIDEDMPEQTPVIDTVTPVVLWEDAALIAVDKASGIETHGPHSLETAVRAYLAGKVSPSLSFRPGPLHRLDKPTSGIVMFSVTLEGAQRFSRLLQERRVHKRYLAFMDGCLDRPAQWHDTVKRVAGAGVMRTTDWHSGDGCEAVTHIIPVVWNTRYSCVIAEPVTGRTHQIRVQAAAHGHPLAGDTTYGGRYNAGGLLLHAFSLDFPGLAYPIQAPIPAPFVQTLLTHFGRSILPALNAHGAVCRSG
jgi:23S rRNA pseudouridine955/2504/2580 synthase